ncbi:tetratricopeptide repeat protein [Micromonospora radicis]|uniref:Tetratricopeptide repeat protein n=1 Tax=Micromonospora radicis TaxID=1894971 RepID=A0A418MXK7_9ACTN|nr:tetratricopeptide repeat protein [Micromonospora radicis]RIV39780.1 tetratricopeptide repeat protein [Micromonospora radicis]
MPSGFGELTDQAHDLVSAGDLAGAQRLLADALTGADPRPVNATPELAEAASLHARVLVALGEPHSARGWAAFAYAATTRLHGRSDPRTVAAAATLAAVLHRVGSWSRAARLYQEVIIELTASDGPESLRVLAAHADLATVEYARGQCQVARERLQDAWELHREVYGDGHPSGIKMLARLGSMQRDCGQFGDAQDNLSLARELSRQHLSPDDPLTAQVAALARAAANPDHVCADTPPVSPQDPVVPAARTPEAVPAPDAGWPEDQIDSPAGWPADDAGPPTAEPSWPRDSSPAWPPYDTPAPGAATTWPDDDPQTSGAATTWPDDDPPAPGTGTNWPPEEPGRSGGWPTQAEPARHAAEEQHPAEGYHPSHGYPSNAPAAASPVPNPRQPADGPAGPPEDWWTSADEVSGGDPYADPPAAASDPNPHHDRPTAVPPSVVGLTGPTPSAPGVYRLRRVDVPERTAPPSRLLPVPVSRTAPVSRPPNRMAPIIAAGVVVVLLGATAVIAGMSRVGGDGNPSTPVASDAPTGAPTPTAGAPDAPPASPGAPPTDLGLRDNRDSVTLNWTYPAGSEGPVVISGGRAGQAPSPFADLPAGTESFVVYGLNRSLDYCFTVAVAWSTDVVARSGEVCTERR